MVGSMAHKTENDNMNQDSDAAEVLLDHQMMEIML